LAYSEHGKEKRMRAKIGFEMRPDGTNIMRVTLIPVDPGDVGDLSTACWHAPTNPNKWVTENVVGSNHYVEQLDLVLPLEKLSQ